MVLEVHRVGAVAMKFSAGGVKNAVRAAEND